MPHMLLGATKMKNVHGHSSRAVTVSDIVQVKFPAVLQVSRPVTTTAVEEEEDEEVKVNVP